ncbi:MAG TPA: TetR/AcrR family transcriptional regulator, partial [Solirubrobacteraceae bacterium]|nr:TetR/AcrR family transcriptional regulator [Solirubrobacteraceae bacterium]
MASPSPPRPPWLPPPRARRRPALTPEAIVEAALRVVDSEGFDALTMRRVAQELGTGGASLYAHVESKEALVTLLMDRVIGELEVPWPPDPERWREQLKELARRVKAIYNSHRDIARGALARIPTGANATDRMERILALLRASGLPDRVVAYAADLLPLYVTAVAYEESLYEARGWTREDLVGFVAELRAYFESLPPERFPNTVALASALTAGAEGDERFEFGLEVILRGLEAMREAGPSARK